MQPPVPLLAPAERLLRPPDLKHLAGRLRKKSGKPDVILNDGFNLFTAENRDPVERCKILPAVEAEGVGLLNEELAIRGLSLIKELPEKQGGKMLPVYKNGDADIPEPVGAFVRTGSVVLKMLRNVCVAFRQRFSAAGSARWKRVQISCHPAPTTIDPSPASIMPIGMPEAR
jgi:hypothetical protein